MVYSVLELCAKHPSMSLSRIPQAADSSRTLTVANATAADAARGIHPQTSLTCCRARHGRLHERLGDVIEECGRSFNAQERGIAFPIVIVHINQGDQGIVLQDKAHGSG